MNNKLTSVQESYRVPDAGGWSLQAIEALHKKTQKQPASSARPALDVIAHEIGQWQETLFADASQALLLVFQGVDAAGKDSTIRQVFARSDPVACRVTAFKEPQGVESKHDFLWRTAAAMPRYGEIGIFNRSYYEAVLTERVHPEFLTIHRPGDPALLEQLWQERFESICDYERHLSRNGVTIVKFWLNVTKGRQAERLLKRIDKPDKRWKFSCQDVYERDHWDDYMQAYLDVINKTSRPWAPWYVIPADHKPTLQLAVAQIILLTLQKMKPAYPVMDESMMERMEVMRRRLDEN